MKISPRICSLVYTCGMLCLLGCGGGGGDPDREETVPVSGIVTYKGDPVEGANVAFVPNITPGQMTNMKGAFGRTDASGRFQLRTYEADDGAIPGSYKVTVTKYEGQAIGEEASEEDYDEPPEGYEPPAPKALLPTQYSNMRTTPLEANITSGEPADLKLELTD
jgi:hypothetical protein